MIKPENPVSTSHRGSTTTARLFIRIDFGDLGSLGPGKVRLLELVEELRSIRAAASQMNMSYRHAWLLLDSMEKTFGLPLIMSRAGGPNGGGTALTVLGEEVINRYRKLEQATLLSVSPLLEELDHVARLHRWGVSTDGVCQKRIGT